MSKTQDEVIQKLADLKAREKELTRKLIPPRHVTEDVTSERLGELMERNNGEMISCSTDARGACKTLFGKYRSGNAGDEDPYIKGYSGDRLTQDRIGRAGACVLNPLLTVVWCMQLDLFDAAYSNTALRDSGFLARCLPCRVEANCSAPRYDNDPSLAVSLLKFAERVNELFDHYHLSEDPPRMVAVDPKAHEALVDYDRAVRLLIDDGTLSKQRIFAARWGEIAYRIALIFHCAEHGTAAHATPLAESTAQSAIQVMMWFAAEQLRMLGSVEEKSDNDKLAIALPFVNRSGPAGISARDLHRHKQMIFKDVADASSALEQLEGEGAIVSRRVGRSLRYFRRSLPGERVIGVS